MNDNNIGRIIINNELPYYAQPKTDINYNILYIIIFSCIIIFAIITIIGLKIKKLKNYKIALIPKQPYIEVVLKNGQLKKYFLSKKRMKIGYSRSNDIIIRETGVSREHCIINKVDNVYYIKDLNSTNGTKVNNKRITETILKDNDEISISKIFCRFNKSN